MAHYSIKDLEKLSGIKAHTLRIWEKRFDLLKPCRTQTNIRFYTNEDLKRILNISFLNKKGYKISRIALLSEEEISQKVADITNSQLDSGTQIDNLIIATTGLDEPRFEKVLNTSILQSGFEQTILNIVYPFLKKIGILWQTGAITPAQEHFITCLVRQKLILAIDGIVETYNAGSKQFLLFLPEEEWHEIGLLFYHYLIKKKGHKVIYLGQSVPFSNLQATLSIRPFDFLVTTISSNSGDQDIYEYIKRLSATFKSKKIILSVFEGGIGEKKLPSNVLKIKDAVSFTEFLQKISLTP